MSIGGISCLERPCRFRRAANGCKSTIRGPLDIYVRRIAIRRPGTLLLSLTKNGFLFLGPFFTCGVRPALRASDSSSHKHCRFGSCITANCPSISNCLPSTIAVLVKSDDETRSLSAGRLQHTSLCERLDQSRTLFISSMASQVADG